MATGDDNFNSENDPWRSRCVVVAPRHEFIRPWIRAYFASGNSIPLVIATGPDGDWADGDMEYCEDAARYSGGVVLDCSKEWKDSEELAGRACLKDRIGWYSKKNILLKVARELSPRSWAWIDDDAEVTGDIEECFEYAERSKGFVCAEFYFPGEICNTRPSRLFRSNIDKDWKMNWNSLVFFHGEANDRLSESLDRDFPVEDDEAIFCNLFVNDKKWRDGFSDFSIRKWQMNCKTMDSIPSHWSGKTLHYTGQARKGEVKRMWAEKSERLPMAPFESFDEDSSSSCGDGAVDAVFVIGKGSVNGNEELRYALRNIDRHCPFVRDVYICGECPSWVDKSAVRHLQWPDRFSHAKDANIIDKLRHACEHPGIAKRILFCSDDQFQTRVCAWEDFFPRYLRRYDPKDKWYELKHRVWHSRLRKTLERDAERRRRSGLDAGKVFYYQPHMWMQIDRDKFMAYARWCGYAGRDDTIIASGYFNYIDAEGAPDSDDPVAFLGINGKVAGGAVHIAYNDGSYAAAMRMLKSMFPDRCRFEVRPEGGAAEPRPKQDARPQIGNGRSADPSPATPEEMSRILDVSAKIRDNPVWNPLLVETSRAEELRLFGVKGWRAVWEDIIGRWERGTQCGGRKVPVSEPRSKQASSVVNAYMDNPESMRTLRFGKAKSDLKSKPPVSISELRNRVRRVADRAAWPI